MFAGACKQMHLRSPVLTACITCPGPKVYRCLLNGEPTAAKVFHIGADSQAQLQFLEEASTLRLLRHKHIVGFAGVCVAGGSGVILMVR